MSKLIRLLSNRWTTVTRGRNDPDGGAATKRQLSAGDVVCYKAASRDRMMCRVALLDGTDMMCELPVSASLLHL